MLEVVSYIFTVSLATIIPPFTAVPIELAAASRYGFALSFTYTLIGNLIGAIVAFYLARCYGWKIIEKLFKKRQVKKAKEIIAHYTFWRMTYSRIIFGSIFDLLTFACGLTKISLGKFILSTIISNAVIISIILAFGTRINLNFFFISLMTAGILVLSIVVVLRRLFKAPATPKS